MFLFSGGINPAMHPEVIYAFLNVREYRHSTRSMEAVADMATLSWHKAVNASALPAPEQMNLHVKADEFFRLVQRARAARAMP